MENGGNLIIPGGEFHLRGIMGKKEYLLEVGIDSKF